jgi:hypothetical protein
MSDVPKGEIRSPFRKMPQDWSRPVFVGAIVLSFLAHGLIWAGWKFGFPLKTEARSTIAMSIVEVPPLPAVEEPQKDAPPLPDEGSPAGPEKNPPPVEDVVKTPPPTPEDNATPPEPKPKPRARPIKRNKEMPDWLQKLKKRRALNRDRARAKRQALIDARRRGRSGKGGGNGKGRGSGQGDGNERGGGGTKAGGKIGTPDDVWACNASDRGVRVPVKADRPLGEWVTIVPSVLMPFDARPGMGSYLGDVKHIMSRDRRKSGIRRVGPAELALPNNPLQMPLENPKGVRLVLGRSDARCLVGFRWTRQLFPITLHKVPMRMIDSGHRTVNALVDITFHKDATFNLKAVDGTHLPFRRGRLNNGNAIQGNIDNHYSFAKSINEVAGWFGIDFRKRRN